MDTTLGIVEVPVWGMDSGNPECRTKLDSTDGSMIWHLPSTASPTNSPTAIPPGLLAARRFGNKTLLEWVVRRVTESLLVDRVVIVTDDQQGGWIERLAPANVSVYVGCQPDPLSRLAGAIAHYRADHLVRVPLTCPFIDPDVIDRLVCTSVANPNCDYVGYFSMDGRPAAASKVGLFAEWCSAAAVFRADRLATRSVDRADSLQFILSHAELFQLRFIPIPERLQRGDVRLMLEADGDWDVADQIVDALGPDRLDWQRIVGLLDDHPALRRRLGALDPAAAAN